MLNLAIRIPDKATMFRDKAHKIADAWVDSLVPELTGKPMTMAEISAMFEAKKHELMGALVKEFIETHHVETLEKLTDVCPKCQRPLRARRMTSRRIESLQGSSLIERPYFLCPSCRVGHVPFDEVLELSPHRKQYDLQRLALDYLSKMP